jgi:hypothetical protein
MQLLGSAVLAVGAHYENLLSSQATIQSYKSRADDLLMKCCEEYPGANVLKSLSLLCWIGLVAGNKSSAWVYNSM